MIGAFGKGDLAGLESVREESNSLSIRRSQVASLDASLAPMYSASVVDRAMSDCFLAFQEIAVWP